MVGNVFYDIAHDSSTPRQTSIGAAIGAAIWCSNGLSYHLVNNTVFRCDGGLYVNAVNNSDPTHNSAIVCCLKDQAQTQIKMILPTKRMTSSP